MLVNMGQSLELWSISVYMFSGSPIGLSSTTLKKLRSIFLYYQWLHMALWLCQSQRWACRAWITRLHQPFCKSWLRKQFPSCRVNVSMSPCLPVSRKAYLPLSCWFLRAFLREEDLWQLLPEWRDVWRHPGEPARVPLYGRIHRRPMSLPWVTSTILDTWSLVVCLWNCYLEVFPLSHNSHKVQAPVIPLFL